MDPGGKVLRQFSGRELCQPEFESVPLRVGLTKFARSELPWELDKSVCCARRACRRPKVCCVS